MGVQTDIEMLVKTGNVKSDTREQNREEMIRDFFSFFF